MTDKLESAIRIRVDPANPGQFLACCGLLELADRLWGGAEGWFEPAVFCLNTERGIEDLLKALTTKLPTEITSLANGLTVKPLIAPLRLELAGTKSSTFIILDAWMTTKLEKGQVVAAANPPWNFWSGQQTSLRIWRQLRESLLEQMESVDDLCSERLFLHRVPLSGRYGFDPVASWNALDVGFSPNDQNIRVQSSPAVELLAAVGIQRFRPSLSGRATFLYATWAQPLSACVAAAVSSGVPTISPTTLYHGRVVDRGSYSALGYSKSLLGGNQ